MTATPLSDSRGGGGWILLFFLAIIIVFAVGIAARSLSDLPMTQPDVS